MTMPLHAHLSDARLLELACTAGDHDRHEEHDLTHVTRCDACSARLARLTLDLSTLRRAANAEADAVIGAARLDRQRRQVLDRIARLGTPARVVSFPGGATASVPVPRPATLRRWLPLTAAAGLLLGLLGGLALRPWSRPSPSWQTARAPQAARASQATTATRFIQTEARADDESLLDDIDAALAIRRISELSALDALTPAAHDVR